MAVETFMVPELHMTQINIALVSIHATATFPTMPNGRVNLHSYTGSRHVSAFSLPCIIYAIQRQEGR